MDVLERNKGDDMKLIVGLGNPGSEYQNTRHNIGFMFVDEVAKANKIDFKLNKSLKCFIGDFLYNGEKIIFCKPVTFMNLSGESVIKVMKFYKIETEDVLVIHDDLDLPVGKIRIRPSGSSGGQKGMTNIINLLGTQEIKRIRIGISKGRETISHVLGCFSEDEKASINLTLSKADDMFKCFVSTTFDKFMNRFN